MSLINDALKRTREAARQTAAARPSEADSYRITSQPETKSSRPRMVVWIAVIVGVIVVAIAGFVAFRLLNHDPEPGDGAVVKHVLPPPPAPVAPPEVPAAPVVPVVTAAVVSSNDDQTADADTTPVSEPDAEPATPKPVVVPDPPKLVLEGITSDELGREALINGVVLKVGEDFLGATVTSIEKRVVRLKFGEREIVLRMP